MSLAVVVGETDVESGTWSLSDDGLEEVLAVLQAHDIARPVARLRPLAVLKG